MSDEPYPPLRPQRPVPQRRQSTPWLMIVGVAVLALLTGAVVAILIGERDGDVGTNASPDGSTTASPTHSGSLSPSDAASESPAGASPAPLQMAADTIVVTTVDGLAVRQEPGTGSERLGRLTSGTPGYVVSGPVEADGFAWFLISGLGLPPNAGCEGPIETDPYNCPVWFGWVAAASEAGEPWLEPGEMDCPEEPFTAEELILARTDLERLACHGGTPFTFRAWYPEIPEDAGLGGTCVGDRPSGWLLCQNINYNHVTIDESEGFGGVGARISIDPASGLTMPERGTWVEVRVHLDDPAAQGCDEAAADTVFADPIPEKAVLVCRGEMVLEAVQAVAGP